MRILIAEDDDLTRRCVAIIVAKIGYEAVEADDGRAAWDIMCRPDAPRLAIVDWMMPGMDGLELCRRVRAAPNAIPAYIIMLTGKDRKNHVVECLDAGADDYLTKPFDSEELRARISIGRRMVETLTTLQASLAARDKALASSQERAAFLTMLQDSVPLPLFVKDVEGRYIDFNRAFEEFFGCRREEKVGKDALSTLSPEQAAVYHAKDMELLRHPGEQVYESPIKDVHGNLRDVVFHKATFCNAEGDVMGLIGVFMDITERKRAVERERLAHDVLERLNHPGAASEAIHDILQLIKSRLGIDAVGMRLRDGDDFPYYETSGFSEEFVHCESHLCALGSDGKPQLACLCGKVLNDQAAPWLPFFTEGGSFWTNSTTDLLAWAKTNNCQLTIRNHCGQAGYESVALIPLKLDETRIGLLQLNDRRRNLFAAETIRFFEGLGSGIGIALARKRADAALQASEERFSKLAEQSRTIMWEVDAEGRYTFVSQVAVAVLGYRPEELIGKMHFHDLHPESGREAFKTTTLKTFAKRTPFVDLENPALTKGGAMVWLLTNGIPILGDDGAPLGYRGADVDITDRKSLELQRLEHEKIMRRNEKFSTLGALVASVAHEINNPNSVITMSVPFLRKIWLEAAPALLAAARGGALKAAGKLPPEQALARVDDMLGGIHRASQRIKRIVQLLRDYIREQPTELKHEPVNLNEVISSSIDMLGSRLKHATDRLSVKFAADPPTIKGDFQRLEQVFINLLVNACDALSDQAQAIEVSSEWAPVTGELRVVVRDEGKGMPKEVLDRVGEPLMTTKHDSGGTGLGVSISMDIVREHGGRILYDSVPGAGTTATVIFNIPANASKLGGADNA